ncbi:GTP-binding protein, putative [Plasmodium sp. DRC-Itaito]|uniref:GTP-binding protein, putative n=1 Tax=Plasmodium gaboni TaxID=647221 RepID=A0ABY1UUU9_9APIC|nr:GTP-binding protein, putative [Plasmodium gaboni]SOV25311.1 GTP-binding protein, putative [Plasmodium sp. DRC-Itaito]
MFNILYKNILHKNKYLVNIKLLHKKINSIPFTTNVHNHLNVEEDYFYVNPLRKLNCIGCGEFLQTTNEKKSGYVPYSVYEKYTNGRLKFYTKVKGEEVDTIPDGVKVDINNFSNYKIKTRIILCKRCYRLQHYKSTDLNCEVDTNRIENIIKCRKMLQQDIKQKNHKNKNIKNKDKENLHTCDDNAPNILKTEHNNKTKNEKHINIIDRLFNKNIPLSNKLYIVKKMIKLCDKRGKMEISKTDMMQNKKSTINLNNDSNINIDNINDNINDSNINIDYTNDSNNSFDKEQKHDSHNNLVEVTNMSAQKNHEKVESHNNEIDNECLYQDNSYNIDKRSINIYEKKDVMKKRNDKKRLDVEKMELSTSKYIEGDRNHIMNNLIKKMKRKSLVLYIIDITNIENTILPELYIGCKNKDLNIIWLVNKVDCLPKSTNLDMIKIWFRNLVRQIKNSHINDLIFISALKFYNYDMLEERMKYYVDIDKGTDIYIVGCVNVGKSTFVNSFLKYINYKHIGDIYNKRKKGGVTTSNIPYTTLNYNVFKLKKNINIIDTIGIPTKYQYSSILYKDIDLNGICINKKIQPFTYKLKQDSSIILGSMCYINFIYGTFSLLTFYLSNKVTVHMCRTEKVESFLEKKKCSFLYPPHINSDFDLLKPFVKHTIKIYGKDFESVDDIVISDLGWFSITGSGTKIFEIYVPKNIKIYRRPSMITDAIKHTQIDVFKFKSYRGRTAKVLKKKKKLIQQLDKLYPHRREHIKNETLQKEQEQIKNLANFNDTNTSIISKQEDLQNILHQL